MKTNTTILPTNPDARVTITLILGIVLAIAGMHHGFFEILQGNTPTNGLFIDSIGEEQRRWIHGSDGAFTLLPNFLITGIGAVLTSITIILWSLCCIRKKHGTSIFLLLFIALTLSGGGIGHIPFFLLIWAYATRIHSPLDWWRKKMSVKLRKVLSRTWLPATLLTGILFLIGLEISVFGYVPGTSDPDKILAVCWSILFASLVLINYSYIAGFAHDIADNDR